MTEVTTGLAALTEALTRLLNPLPGGRVWVVSQTSLLDTFGVTAEQAVLSFQDDASFEFSSAAAMTGEIGHVLLLATDAALFYEFLEGRIEGNMLKLVLAHSEQPLAPGNRTRH